MQFIVIWKKTRQLSGKYSNNVLIGLNVFLLKNIHDSDY